LLLSYLGLTGCQQPNKPNFQGYVEGELLFMASPFSGILQTLSVHRGEKVTKGQSLFSLDPQPEQAQLAQATRELQQAKATLQDALSGQRETVLKAIEAQIKQASAELSLVKVRLQRTTTLYQKAAIDADSLDAAKTDYATKLEQLKQLKANLAEAKQGRRVDIIQAQRANVKALEAKVSQAAWALQQKIIAAPVAATVFDTYFKKGEWVEPGKPVVSLLSPENIRVIFFVPESMLAKIHLRQKVAISCDQCKKAINATVSYISPEAEYTPPLIYSRESNYKLVFRIKAIPMPSDAMNLHPGQPVYVTISR